MQQDRSALDPLHASPETGDMAPGVLVGAPALARVNTSPVVFKDLVALTKPRLSALVMITCGGGMFLAPGQVAPLRAVVALFATAMVVGGANALNSYLERDLDRHMERTRRRPLPDGRLDPRLALVLAFVLTLLATPALTFLVNPLTGLLACVALATYVLLYTPLKQRSALSLWVGAIPGAMPPLMGWTAVQNRIELPAVVLFAILFFWQIPHFIAIGMYRREDYARAGHKILPLVVGSTAVKVHAVAWTALLVASTLLLVPLGVAGWGYGIIAGLLGAGFFTWAMSGFFVRQSDERRWARGFFLSSLVYLTLLFVALSFGAS